MTRLLMTGVAAVVWLVAASPAQAGGPPPMYVVIDKVVLEPAGRNAERITILGSFIREKARESDFGKPVEGSVTFVLNEAKAAECRTEWKKLEKAAGTGKVVALGMCGDAGNFLTVKIRKPGERSTDAEAVYTPGYLTSIDAPGQGNWTKQPAVKTLLAFVKERKDARADATRSTRP